MATPRYPCTLFMFPNLVHKKCPPVHRSPSQLKMLPLVFQNTQRLKYDKPRVKRDRDHLLRPGALFSVKIGSYWFPVGVIDQVDVTLTVSKPNTEPFWLKRFRTKNDLICELGGEPISNFERSHGLIPMAFKK